MSFISKSGPGSNYISRWELIRGSLSFDLFKRPTDITKNLISINSEINIDDYIRIGMALKRMKAQTRPYKISKLINLISRMSSNKKKKYALLLVEELIEQGLIKIDGKTVLYKNEAVDNG